MTALAGRTVAALAFATELAASACAGSDYGDLVDRLTQTLPLITEWGTAIEAAARASEDAAAVYEAAIHRTIRKLERGTKHLAGGIVPLDGDNADSLASAFGAKPHYKIKL